MSGQELGKGVNVIPKFPADTGLSTLKLMLECGYHCGGGGGRGLKRKDSLSPRTGFIIERGLLQS
jgi:hypothetical protein